MIISLVTEKGGTGKTSLATNLAAYWASQGRDVVGWDFDPQQSFLEWHRDRQRWVAQEPEAFLPMGIEDGRRVVDWEHLEGEMARVDAPERLVLLDAPGSDSMGLRLGLLAGDVLVVPLRPGGIDLKVAERMIDLLTQAAAHRAQVVGRAPRMCMVFNGVKSRSTVHREHRAMLRARLEGTPIALLDKGVGDYADFSWAGAQGMGVTDLDASSKASQHVRRLADALLCDDTWSA